MQNSLQSILQCYHQEQYEQIDPIFENTDTSLVKQILQQAYSFLKQFHGTSHATSEQVDQCILITKLFLHYPSTRIPILSCIFNLLLKQTFPKTISFKIMNELHLFFFQIVRRVKQIESIVQKNALQEELKVVFEFFCQIVDKLLLFLSKQSENDSSNWSQLLDLIPTIINSTNYMDKKMQQHHYSFEIICKLFKISWNKQTTLPLFHAILEMESQFYFLEDSTLHSQFQQLLFEKLETISLDNADYVSLIKLLCKVKKIHFYSLIRCLFPNIPKQETLLFNNVLYFVNNCIKYSNHLIESFLQFQNKTPEREYLQCDVIFFLLGANHEMHSLSMLQQLSKYIESIDYAIVEECLLELTRYEMLVEPLYHLSFYWISQTNQTKLKLSELILVKCFLFFSSCRQSILNQLFQFIMEDPCTNTKKQCTRVFDQLMHQCYSVIFEESHSQLQQFVNYLHVMEIECSKSILQSFCSHLHLPFTWQQQLFVSVSKWLQQKQYASSTAHRNQLRQLGIVGLCELIPYLYQKERLQFITLFQAVLRFAPNFKTQFYILLRSKITQKEWQQEIINEWIELFSKQLFAHVTISNVLEIPVENNENWIELSHLLFVLDSKTKKLLYYFELLQKAVMDGTMEKEFLIPCLCMLLECGLQQNYFSDTNQLFTLLEQLGKTIFLNQNYTLITISTNIVQQIMEMSWKYVTNSSTTISLSHLFVMASCICFATKSQCTTILIEMIVKMEQVLIEHNWTQNSHTFTEDSMIAFVDQLRFFCLDMQLQHVNCLSLKETVFSYFITKALYNLSMQCTINYLNHIFQFLQQSQSSISSIKELQTMIQEYHLPNATLVQYVIYFLLHGMVAANGVIQTVQFIETNLLKSSKSHPLLQTNITQSVETKHRVLLCILEWIEKYLQYSETIAKDGTSIMKLVILILQQPDLFSKYKNVKSKIERIMLKMIRLVKFCSVTLWKRMKKDKQTISQSDWEPFFCTAQQVQKLFLEIWSTTFHTLNCKQYFSIAMNSEKLRKYLTQWMTWQQQQQVTEWKELKQLISSPLEWLLNGVKNTTKNGEEAAFFQVPITNKYKNTALRSRNSYIDQALAIEGGDETFADLEDFVVTSDEDIV